jgi:hypothetical protein
LRHSERPGARGGKRRRRRKAEGVENGKAALLKDDYRYKPGSKQNQGRVAVEAAGPARDGDQFAPCHREPPLCCEARTSGRSIIADHPAMTIARGSPQGLRQGLREGLREGLPEVLCKGLPASSAWPIPP